MNDDEGTSDPPDGRTDDPAVEPAESEGEWRFSLEDIREREAAATAAKEAEERRNEPVEAGKPSLEGAALVVLGVAFTLFVISRLFIG